MENTNIQILESQKAEIKTLFAPTLTDSEFNYFLGLAKSLNANPFKREIYAIKYGNQLSIFCGRDLYRRVAQEQPDYLVHTASAIYENDIYEKNNGVITHKTTLKNRGALIGGYCSLWKKNCNIPFTVEVMLAEYGKQTQIWKQIPATMIAKVAESQVLRMAYQGIFAGTYDESEEWKIETPAKQVDNDLLAAESAKIIKLEADLLVSKSKKPATLESIDELIALIPNSNLKPETKISSIAWAKAGRYQHEIDGQIEKLKKEI